MSEKEVIAAIRRSHLKANISNTCYVRHHWDEAWLDPGGTVFGPGPYVKLPVDALVSHGSDETERVVIRVYPTARLRRKLADVTGSDRRVEASRGDCEGGVMSETPQVKRVNFTLHVYGSTDRHFADWADGVARWLQSELNDNARDAGFPQDVTVDVEDYGEGG